MTTDQITEIRERLATLAGQITALTATVAALQSSEREDRAEAAARKVALTRLDERQNASERRMARIETAQWGILLILIGAILKHLFPGLFP